MMYYIVLFFVKLVSLLPFRLLYGLSDFMYLIFYRIIKYRKNVVRKNLTLSFPEKTASEIEQIEKKFYHHFCDLIVEGIKLKSISGKELEKRMKFYESEQLIEHYHEGRSVMLMASHYGNWEWTSLFSKYLPKDKPVYQVYKKQSGKIVDRMIGDIRQRFGARNVDMKHILRTIIEMKRENKMGMFGMISDQRPRLDSIHYWTTFLNQETAIIDGTEQIAKKFNFPVYYCSFNKVKRGYYTCTFVCLSTDPQNTGEHEITEKYARLLEADIKQAPEFWLWTHNRWKHGTRGKKV